MPFPEHRPGYGYSHGRGAYSGLRDVLFAYLERGLAEGPYRVHYIIDDMVSAIRDAVYASPAFDTGRQCHAILESWELVRPAPVHAFNGRAIDDDDQEEEA